LATHDEVEVAQADVEVDDGRLVPAQGQAGGKAGAGGGLAHPALAGGDDDDTGHGSVPSNRMLQADRESITSLSPSGVLCRRTCAGLPCSSAGRGTSLVR